MKNETNITLFAVLIFIAIGTYVAVSDNEINLAGAIEWVYRGFYFASGATLFLLIFGLALELIKWANKFKEHKK